MQPSGRRFQKGASASKQNSASNSGSAKKKSVKFAHLPEKVMAQYRVEGRCFLCGEIGHLSRNCDKKHKMPGDGSSKPLGVPSYSMEMSVIKNDEENDDVLDSMPVGAVGIEPARDVALEEIHSEHWRDWYPLWNLC